MRIRTTIAKFTNFGQSRVELFLTLLLAATLFAHPARSEQYASSTLQTLVDAQLSQALTINAKGNLSLIRQSDGWLLACGTPKTAQGNPIDYALTSLATLAADGLVDDQFCALFEDQTGSLTLREFDVGSTDAPLLGWMETYALPETLLD